jgi:hypothetical protein
VDGAHEGEQHPILEAVPRVLLVPGMALTRFSVLDLAAGQGAKGETRACRLVPPARARERKPPQDRLLFRQEDQLAALGALRQGRECEPSIRQVSRMGVEPPRGATRP